MFPQCSETLKSTTVHSFFTGLLQKDSVTEEDIEHPDFQTFLNTLKPAIAEMDAFQLSDIAFGIIKYKALVEHGISSEVCDAILMKLENLPFQRMLQLDYKMRKSESSSSFSEKIQPKIQEIFLKNVAHHFSHHNNDMKELYAIATYISDHSEIVPMDILKQFSSALVLLDEHRLNILDVSNMINAFSRFDELDGESRIALKKMVKLWIEYDPTPRDVKQLLAFISGSRKIDKLAFEESGLIRFTLNYLEENCNYEIFPCYGHLMKMVF